MDSEANETTAYLTTDEAGNYLRMSPATLLEKAAAGVIRDYRPGRRWLFDGADLDEYVQSGSNSTLAPYRRRRRRV